MQIKLSADEIQRRIDYCPFQAWLGLRVTEASIERTVIELPWRKELMSNPDAKATHGGVLTTLIDTVGGYSLAVSLGYTLPTLDIRVDFHRVAKPGILVGQGTPLKIGRLVAVAEARVLQNERLIASGKIVFQSKSLD